MIRAIVFDLDDTLYDCLHENDKAVEDTVEYIGKLENAALQSDTDQVGYDWLDITTLNTTPLYPSKLRRQIMNLHEGKAYKVYLGNEEIGDPEITD